jgi:hypothetical protein
MITESNTALSPAGLHLGTRSPNYERHCLERTTLHTIVREQLDALLARAREADHPVPRFVERELRAYLACGVLTHGFRRPHCAACATERLAPFSCKRRGSCPSCGGRRMADTAAHLVDCVLPEVPVRQWLFTLPHPPRHPRAQRRSCVRDHRHRARRSSFPPQPTR